MENTTTSNAPKTGGNISETIRQERRRLLDFIRRRIPSEEDAEDVLQDVWYELVESYRLMKPIEQVASWLFKVARNRITDWYRKREHSPMVTLPTPTEDGEEGEVLLLTDLLVATDASPDSRLMRETIMGALTDALEELPPEQRDVFVMHELEDRPFKEIVELTGVGLKTLISRKRYAVLYLRERLSTLYQEVFS